MSTSQLAARNPRLHSPYQVAHGIAVPHSVGVLHTRSLLPVAPVAEEPEATLTAHLIRILS